MGLGHQAQHGLFGSIGCHSQKLQTHTTGDGTNSNTIDHSVESEVILAVAVFLGRVNISENHLCDTLNNSCGINRGFVSDGSLYILLLIGEEVVGLSGSANVVLAKKTVQGISNFFAQAYFVGTDIISHENDNVVKIGRYIIINIADQI